MAETATYELTVDWNNDGDFADAGEDLTDDFRSATIDRGFDGPLARVAGVANASFALNNLSRQYSPPLDADIVPRRPVRFRMTYSGTTETLFRGYLEDIIPSFGQYGPRQVTLQSVGPTSVLDLDDGEIALLSSVYADDVIEEVVSAVFTPVGTSYQAGINWFPTSSPGWQHDGRSANEKAFEQVRATQKIKDACVSDWGRFFVAGDGTATFHNRHQTALDDSTELTLDDTMLDMDYHYPVSVVKNYIEVTCYPRTVGTIPEVLGQLSQTDAPVIEDSDSVTFVLRFRDTVNSSVRIGGKDVITPVASTDYDCTSDPAGEGDDETSNVSASLTSYGDRAEITLTNSAGHRVWVQRLRVRGYAVRAREPITVVAQDATSIAAYGRRRLQVDAPLMSNPTDAQLLADYLLNYYKDPLNVVRGIRIMANKNATWMAAVRDLELNDRVVISETQTGLSSFAGYVTRIRHQINSRWEHYMLIDIEEAYTIAGTPFRIGISALNSGHVLIY